MKSPKPQNSTTEFFEKLEKEGKITNIPASNKAAVDAKNARLEKVSREFINKARRSEISASKVVLNA